MKRLCLLTLMPLLFSCQKEQKKITVAEESAIQFTRKTWSVARGGAGLSGTTSDPVINDPEIAWVYKTEGPIVGEAIVADGFVVFGNDLGVLSVLNAETGKPVWSKEYEDALEAAPAIHDGTVFVGCQDSFLYALDLKSGEEKWKYETDDKITAGVNIVTDPSGSDQWVILNGYDGTCRALKADDGSVVWQHVTEEFINGSPAIVDGKWIVFGGCDRILYTLDLGTGKPVKKIETDAEIVSTVATAGTFVAWGNYGNEVLSADVEKGECTWTYKDRKFPFMSAPAIDDNLVVIGCRDKKLHAISRVSGESLWKFKTGGRVESSPILFNDAAVFGSSDGRLYAIGLEKGAEIWQLDLGESIIAPPSFANGTIYVGGEDGTLFAVR
ncbi:PQQ-binding-like beta-propeller repeat protein [Akkermansiaceae bacterium]|nr:PQQ-binding-like beta-propeller repeat protein [Akkermansiaceae bacterium]